MLQGMQDVQQNYELVHWVPKRSAVPEFLNWTFRVSIFIPCFKLNPVPCNIGRRLLHMLIYSMYSGGYWFLKTVYSQNIYLTANLNPKLTLCLMRWNSLEFSHPRCFKSPHETRFGRGSTVKIILKYVFFSQDFILHHYNNCFLFIVAPIYDMEKHCNIEIAAQISRVPPMQNSM